MVPEGRRQQDKWRKLSHSGTRLLVWMNERKTLSQDIKGTNIEKIVGYQTKKKE